jgi:fructuronate reductase
MTQRLSRASLSTIQGKTNRPAYNPRDIAIGVVHFGPGAFHRAHQADFFDHLLAEDARWGICAVSLKSAGVRDALAPQDGLYTLVELDTEVRFRVIGALKEVLVATDAPNQVMARLVSPDVRLITLTVTEKGYCLDGSGRLDPRNEDIRHDIAAPAAPKSVIGWLAAGLRARREAGLPAISVLSCDNLADNGRKLAAAVGALAMAQGDPDLAAWITQTITFPNSMVDSITPATDDALRARVKDHLGLIDAWPIQRERFAQWVVEDRLVEGAPNLAAVGVTVTADVRPFERAKLRLLNGAHTTLAYLGLAMGCRTVGDAMSDPDLSRFVERMMREDIIPTLPPVPDLDLTAYVEAVLERFRNPAIQHQLSQIAWDGSQKLPFRILETISDRLALGLPPARLAVPIAAWMQFIVGAAKDGRRLVDPMAETLMRLGAESGEANAVVDRFLALDSVFPPLLTEHAEFRAAVAAAYASLSEGDALGALSIPAGA